MFLSKHLTHWLTTPGLRLVSDVCHVAVIQHGLLFLRAARLPTFCRSAYKELITESELWRQRAMTTVKSDDKWRLGSTHRKYMTKQQESVSETLPYKVADDGVSGNEVKASSRACWAVHKCTASWMLSSTVCPMFVLIIDCFSLKWLRQLLL